MSPRQTTSLGDKLLQLLFRFIVSTVYVAYLPRSYIIIIIVVVDVLVFVGVRLNEVTVSCFSH